MKELTIVEVAEKTNRNRSTVLRWVKQNLFPNATLKNSPLGDYWIIPEDDLKNFKAPKPGPKTDKK